MNLEDYTPGTICRSLGLGEFQTIWKRGLPTQELKVLLCPSFHPELCLVFWEEDRQTQVRATCAQSQIWALPSLASVATATNTGSFSEPTLPQLEQTFREALVQPDRRGVVTLDGMSVHIVWRNFDSRLVVEGVNPSADDALGAFVSTAIKLAFNALSDSACRDGLANAGLYAGLKLPYSVPRETKLGPM